MLENHERHPQSSVVPFDGQEDPSAGVFSGRASDDVRHHAVGYQVSTQKNHIYILCNIDSDFVTIFTLDIDSSIFLQLFLLFVVSVC